MSLNESFDPKNSIELFGLRKNFNFLKGLYNSKKLPNITLISGEKGLGKSTLINHLLFYIFDKKNYNENNFTINAESHFYKLFKTNIFQNIIYYSGDKFKNIKIDDIRNLKKRIYQKSIINDKRFIIFDDIEIINDNGLNALLKILEEPTKNNYFILIDNKSKILKETIKSRCIEFKIILSESEKKILFHL